MDIKKLNIPKLDGPNWGQFVIHLQAAARILDCYNVLRGEILTPPPNPTYDLLAKPTHPGVQASTTDLMTYNAVKAVWNKKNAQALSLMQATVLPVIWQNYAQYSDEPPHQIRSYTLLFSFFLCFLYITDPPLCTSAPTRLHSCLHNNCTCSIGPISLI